MTTPTHCSDCGEDHTGHHDRTAISRNGAGLYVQPCDPSVRGGGTFGDSGGRVSKQHRFAADDAYRASRLHHENECMANGDGYVDPRDLPDAGAARRADRAPDTKEAHPEA